MKILNCKDLLIVSSLGLVFAISNTGNASYSHQRARRIRRRADEQLQFIGSISQYNHRFGKVHK